MTKRNAYWHAEVRGYSRQFGKRMQRARARKRMMTRVDRALDIRAKQWRGRHTLYWDLGNEDPDLCPF